MTESEADRRARQEAGRTGCAIAFVTWPVPAVLLTSAVPSPARVGFVTVAVALAAYLAFALALI